MKTIDTLLKYFALGRAEQERDILPSVFIQTIQYADLICPPKNSLRLVVGNKGSGKSAIFTYLDLKSQEAGIPCVLLKPDDIIQNNFEDQKSIATMKRSYYQSLIASIALQLGSTTTGLVPEREMTLLEKAKESGKVGDRLSSRITKFLIGVGKETAKIDFAPLLPAYSTDTGPLRAAIKSNLERTKKVFYVLIDDTDQIAHPEVPMYLEKLWSIVLASAKIAEECENIKIIISYRHEIYQRMIQDDHGARDQVDHFRTITRYLRPTIDDVSQVVSARMIEGCKEMDLAYKDPYVAYFENRSVNLPGSKDERHWSDVIGNNSRLRPRDAIQFVNMLGQNCRDDVVDRKIQYRDLMAIIEKYSTERVDDIVNENQRVCPQLKLIIKSFHQVNNVISATDLKDHISGLPGIGTIQCSNITYRKSDDLDMIFAIWKLLYDIQFLTPQRPDARQPRGFVHVRPWENPDLVSPRNWAEMQSYSWDIHPCYRSYIQKERDDRSFMRKAVRAHRESMDRK